MQTLHKPNEKLSHNIFRAPFGSDRLTIMSSPTDDYLVSISIPDWVASAADLSSEDEYLKSAVNLALMLTY